MPRHRRVIRSPDHGLRTLIGDDLVNTTRIASLHRLDERMPFHALVDFDEPEPTEEYDDDDVEDDDEDCNVLIDILDAK